MHQMKNWRKTKQKLHYYFIKKSIQNKQNINKTLKKKHATFWCHKNIKATKNKKNIKQWQNGKWKTNEEKQKNT